jgi:ATP-dependent Clp protease ATP-binding subunit ClpA
MFERFTDRARQTVVLAQEEARRLNHPYIGTEHLLLGLIREGDGAAAKALRRLGIGLPDAREAVVDIIGEGAGAPSGHIPFTPRSKKVLELSLREALQMGHNYIGTEHILLGMIREGEGVAAQVLIRRGADLNGVRAMVLTELSQFGGLRQQRLTPRRTPGAEEALANAQRIAASTPVGSHHLLEALARSEDTLAGKVLASLGVDPETLAAAIDEMGTEGTSDATPEETAARLMELRIEADVAYVVLRDESTVELVRTITQPFDGPLRGDDPAAGSMAGLWQAIVGGLEEIRGRVAPPADDPGAASDRPNIVRQAIQSRFARRKRDR